MDGSFPAHSRLPDGKQWAADYGVSLMTMKRALDVLVAEGYIIRRRGDGTFVRDWKSCGLSRNYSLKGAFETYQRNLTSRVLTFEIIPADEVVAEKLSLDVGSFVYHIIRVRLLEGRPIIMEYTYMPVAILPTLTLAHVETSIYGFLRKEMGRSVHSAVVKISSARPTERECREMGLTDRDYLMAIEQVACLDNCHVFEYAISHHLPDVFSFETVVFHQ